MPPAGAQRWSGRREAPMLTQASCASVEMQAWRDGRSGPGCAGNAIIILWFGAIVPPYAPQRAAGMSAVARAARTPRRAHQKHRQGRLAQHQLGVAAHDHAREPAAAVGAEHDEVSTPLLGLLDDQ